MIRKALIAAIVIPLAFTAAMAIPLVGGSVGAASLSADNASPSFHFSGNDVSWKLYGGFHFLPFLRIEAGYLDFGSVSGSIGGISAKSSSTGWDAFAVGALPIGGFEVFAKAGLVRLRSDFDVEGVGSQSDTELDAAYGVGGSYRFAGPLRVRVEYERFDAKPEVFGARPDTKLHLISAGLEFRF